MGHCSLLETEDLGEDRAVAQEELVCPRVCLSVCLPENRQFSLLDSHCHNRAGPLSHKDAPRPSSSCSPQTFPFHTPLQGSISVISLFFHPFTRGRTLKIAFQWFPVVGHPQRSFLPRSCFHHRSSIAAGLHGYNGILVGLLMAVYSDKGDYYWWLLPPVAVISMAW